MDDRQALKVRFANFGSSAPPPVPASAAPVALAVNDTLSEPASAPLMRAGFDKVQLKVRRTQSRLPHVCCMRLPRCDVLRSVTEV